MEQPAPKQHRMTINEYLRFDDESDNRHELHSGIAVAMSGATYEHNSINGNISQALRNRLKGDKCRVQSSDLRVRIGKTLNYYYPDITVVCGSPVFDPPDRRVTLINPQVIFEITSPSSEAYDRRDKFYNYMTIESLQEYIIVDQERARIDTFYRHTDGIWAIGGSVEGLDGAIMLRSLGIELPAKEIYADVEFAAPPSDSSGEKM